jgi:hypothetical protein
MDLMNAVRARLAQARAQHGKTWFIGFDVSGGAN